MTITRNFKLYLNAGTASAPYINVNQYDEGEEWVFTLYNDDGSTYTPSSGAIIGIKSDGNAIMNSGSVVGGKVVINETQQMTAASGLAVFELLIEGETHGTANFIVNVERRPSDDAEFSDSDLSMLQEAIDSVAEIEGLLDGETVDEKLLPMVQSETSDWLTEHITNPSNPPIDTSLTVAGAAADAKKTGDEIADLKSAVTNLDNVVLPQTVDATEALAYYPLTPSVGDKILITSKGGAYTKTWSALFYASDKSTLLQQQNVTSSEITKEITITESGIAYVRPNTNFSVGAIITVLSGDTLVEKADSQANLIDTNTQAIAKITQDIADIKSGKNNLYDGIELISGRVFNGVFSDAISTVHCTDFLPITSGRIYAIYGGYFDANYSNYYDSSKTYKGSLPLNGLNTQYPYGNSSNFLLFTAPSDAAYTRVNFMNSHLIDGTDMRPEWFFRDVTDLVWAKKKVLVIGDSISTDVYGGYKKWVTNLLDEEFLTNGLTNNNSQHATGFVATYNGQANTTFIQRLTAVGDLSNFDAIITFGGINDWIQGVNFDTFTAAVDTYFEYLIENATQARIIVFTPLHTALYGSTNSAGKTQKDYDDYIKSVAVDYAFPLLNLTDESGFCPDKSETFNDMWTLLPEGFSSHDGVHPNADWEKDFLAPMIKGFLTTIG